MGMLAFWQEAKRRFPGIGEIIPHSHIHATACPGDKTRAYIPHINTLLTIDEDTDMTPDQAAQLKAIYDLVTKDYQIDSANRADLKTSYATEQGQIKQIQSDLAAIKEHLGIS